MQILQPQPFIEPIQSSLRNHTPDLSTINNQIWSTPELGFTEHHAHDTICTFFESLNSDGNGNAYTIHRHAYGLPTAFLIESSHGTDTGKQGRTITFNAEYDALPGVGHACGHNLIATASTAAFIATCSAMKSYTQTNSQKKVSYTIRLLGTPAEESHGGKIKLLDAGAYTTTTACLMIHPVPIPRTEPNLLSIATTLPGGFLANNKLRVTFTGKAAHAAAAPWEGINALDAVVSAYVNISLLRQQILPSQRIHGVIAQGGERANVIPRSAVVDYYVRAERVGELGELTGRVVRCFEAAAVATGCEVHIEWGPSYADIKTNTPLCKSYISAMRTMGHEVSFDNTGKEGILTGASTDMGNVSHAIPGFHGLFTIPTDGVNHTPEFTSGAGSEEAFERSLKCAAGMAVVACRVLVEDGLAGEVRRDFEG